MPPPAAGNGASDPLKSALQAKAVEEGFDALHICQPSDVPQVAERLNQFLKKQYHGQMTWLKERKEWRGDPSRLWPEARSVIMLAHNYGPQHDPLRILKERGKAAISVYAQNKDYHNIIKKRLKSLARWLISEAGGEVKVYVDTAPVPEKPLAQAAGLGWQGKHTNLVSRQYGNWLFIGSVFTTLTLPVDLAEVDHCGSCSACLLICPTEAFPKPYQLDARRCISYLTIEHKGPVALDLREKLGNRIYGCDDCQLVCPWNKFATISTEPDFAPRWDLDNPNLVELFSWTEDQFSERLQGSPIRRIGYEKWLRNIAVALGNADTSPEILQALKSRENHASSVVREHVAWALNQHN